MKNGKNPTREQKKRISEMGLNPDNWLVVKDTPNFMQILNRDTGNVRIKEK